MSDGLNKTLLKKFAVESRDELRAKIVLKANIYGITKELSDKDRKTNGKEGFIPNDNVVIILMKEVEHYLILKKFKEKNLLKKFK